MVDGVDVVVLTKCLVSVTALGCWSAAALATDDDVTVLLFIMVRPAKAVTFTNTVVKTSATISDLYFLISAKWYKR